jgi:hypothetical protein
MLRWTTAGAVPSPTTVQIRVQRSYPGRVRAGAPVPTRSMSTAELLDNIRFFTAGMRTPRTRPCETLVLSGVGVAAREDCPEAIALARSQGIARVILHAGVEDLDQLLPKAWVGAIDVLVVPVQPGGGTLAAAARALTAAREAGLRVAANTTLSTAALPHLIAAARVLATARPHEVTFTYPFPINGADPTEVPTPARVEVALRPALAVLDAAGLNVGIKGLPACLLGKQARRLRRTANRWYVDADHQGAQALLFFPDVVAFHKDEICRFCAADERCDGFFSAYLRRPGAAQLQPIDEP